MKLKKLVSVICAISVVISAFMGITVSASNSETDIADTVAEVTTELPEAPKFSDLERTAIDTELFDSADFATLDAGKWDFNRADYKNFTTRTSAVSFAYERWMQYSQGTQADGLFYYQYKIRMYHETADTQLVKLVGENGEYTTIASPAAYGGNKEYITVVDPENNVAHTYDYKGNYISSVSIGDDTIKGIKFENTENVSSNTFYLYDFYYGSVVNTAATPEPTATPTPSPTATPEPTATPVPEIPEAPAYKDLTLTAVDTELFDSADFATLDAGKWDFNRADYKNFTVRTSAVSFAWQRWMQYNQTVPADGMFYYQYKIRMYATTDTQLVKLVGEAGEYAITGLSAAVGANSEYITVVDPANSVAHTYTYKGEFVSSISLGGDTITGIKFENTENVETNTFYIYDFYYGTVADENEVQETVTFAEEVQFDPNATVTNAGTENETKLGTLRFKAAITEKNFKAQKYGFKFVNFSSESDSIANHPSYTGDSSIDTIFPESFVGDVDVNDVFYHDITGIPQEVDGVAVTGVGFYAVPYVYSETGEFFYGTPFTFEKTFDWTADIMEEIK